MSIRVERMTPGDVCAVAAIDGATQMSEEQLRAELDRPFARAWVARHAEAGVGAEAGPVVAYVVTWHVVDELHVLNVATRPDRRRRGLGRALMGALIEHARTHKIRHALLEVRRSNGPAIALYRQVGFFAMGVRARYYPDDEDAIEMVLAFDPASGAIVPHEDEVRLHDA